MPIRITVGLQQKVGRPNYGSLGASCHLELALDEQDARDPDRLRAHVQSAFATCRQRITEALRETADASPDIVDTAPPAPTRNGRPPRAATAAQLRAIRAIIRRHGMSLDQQLQSHFGHQNLQQLSLQQASQLIDALNSELAVG